MQLQKILVLLHAIAAASFVKVDHAAMQAFAQFLQLNQLRHAIVVLDADQRTTYLRMRALADEQRLVRVVSVRAKAVQCDFAAHFYASSPRVGVFVSPLESVAVQQSVFAPAAGADLFNNSQAWFILSVDGTNFDANVERVFGALKINIDADITLARQTANNSLALYDLYKVSAVRSFPLEIAPKGSWTAEMGLQVRPEFRESFSRRRRNFRNMIIPAGTLILEKPANMNALAYLRNVKDNKHLDSMQRKTYNLLKILEPMLNVSFEVVFSDTWGQYVAGNWTGVIGNVLAKKVDFAICPIRFTLERVHVVQYTPEIHTEIVRFLLRHPRRNVIRNIFFAPLADAVWWSVLALMLLTPLLLALHVQHEHRLQQLTSLPPLERRFDAMVLVIMEALLMQGPAPSLYRRPATRILMLTLCAFSVMLLQFYAAFIVGSLLAQEPRSITTLPALFNSSLEIGMEHVVYNYEIFVNSTNKVANDFYAQRIAVTRQPNSGHILTLERGAQRIGRGGFAFHVAVDRAYHILKYLLTESEFCDLQEIALQPPFTTSSVLRKNSPYREYFATIILYLRNTGLLQYSDKMWAVQKTDCSLKRNTEVEVDMEHFVPALLLLAVAMLISVFVLAVELTANCWCRWKRNEQEQQRQRQEQQQRHQQSMRQQRKMAKIRKLQQRENF